MKLKNKIIDLKLSLKDIYYKILKNCARYFYENPLKRKKIKKNYNELYNIINKVIYKYIPIFDIISDDSESEHNSFLEYDFDLDKLSQASLNLKHDESEDKNEKRNENENENEKISLIHLDFDIDLNKNEIDKRTNQSLDITKKITLHKNQQYNPYNPYNKYGN